MSGRRKARWGGGRTLPLCCFLANSPRTLLHRLPPGLPDAFPRPSVPGKNLRLCFRGRFRSLTFGLEGLGGDGLFSSPIYRLSLDMFPLLDILSPTQTFIATENVHRAEPVVVLCERPNRPVKEKYGEIQHFGSSRAKDRINIFNIINRFSKDRSSRPE